MLDLRENGHGGAKLTVPCLSVAANRNLSTMRRSQDKSVPPRRTECFTKQERVRLTFLLKDLFPPGTKHFLGARIGGYEWDFLYEFLQRAFGRKEIGVGFEAVIAIEDFITAGATEDELLTMLELLPLAYEKAYEYTAGSYAKPSQSELKRITAAVNRFLDRIGSPARFKENGVFVRDGGVDAVPSALHKLPGREQLRGDLLSIYTDILNIALAFIDLDNFKAVNDEQGHSAGDTCLELIVSTIGEVIVGKGKLYRYGGDEFVVVLPNYTSGEAAATAERIRCAIEDANAGGMIKVTASIGVSALDIDGLIAGELLESSDAAMYVSKDSSKNCVTIWARGMTPAGR